MTNVFFQQTIEDMIRRVVREDRYSQLSAEQISELSLQLTLFISNILLSVAGALLIALIAYFLVNRHQTQSARVSKEIERQRLLHELEKQYQTLSVQPCVWLKDKAGFDGQVTYHFIIALTREVKWFPPEQIQYHWHTGDRLVVFTQQGDLISSTVLHEVLFWFRRLHRAANSELITPDDLYAMWRQILPFVTDNRYCFLATYFGGANRRGAEDIDAIRQIAANVLRYCQQQQKTVPLDYLNGRIDSLFYDELPKNMKNGLEPGKQQVIRKEPSFSLDDVNIDTRPEDTIKLS